MLRATKRGLGAWSLGYVLRFPSVGAKRMAECLAADPAIAGAGMSRTPALVRAVGIDVGGEVGDDASARDGGLLLASP